MCENLREGAQGCVTREVHISMTAGDAGEGAQQWELRPSWVGISNNTSVFEDSLAASCEAEFVIWEFLRHSQRLALNSWSSASILNESLAHSGFVILLVFKTVP